MPLALGFAAAEDRVHDVLGESERRELDAFVLQILENPLKADAQLLRRGALADVHSDHPSLFVEDRSAGGTVEGDGLIAEEMREVGYAVVGRNVAFGELEDIALRMLN